MFPEYRTLISRLKNEDAHFAGLFMSTTRWMLK
ncbi:hypothetical protein Senen10_04486 [Salmonella enterica subsp. enterica]